MRASCLLAIGMLAGTACGRFGFDLVGAAPGDGAGGGSSDTNGSADPDALTDSNALDAAGYQATGMHFSVAEGDYLSNGALTGAVNSTSGIASAWIRMTGADGTQQQFLTATVAITGGITRNTTNRIQILLANCNTTLTLQSTSNAALTAAMGWVHVMASWDTAMNKFDLYLNDTRDTATATMGSMPTCYTASQWGYGGMSAATLDADIADVYLATGVYLDLSQVANRRLFRDAQGKPVNLGNNCTAPTGAQPLVCFTGAPVGWPTNKGSGGGFTVNGNGLMNVSSP